MKDEYFILYSKTTGAESLNTELKRYLEKTIVTGIQRKLLLQVPKENYCYGYLEKTIVTGI